MVSIKNLQAFIELAKCQSFAEAAEKRHISQPALSSAIKKMEMQLGGALYWPPSVTRNQISVLECMMW